MKKFLFLVIAILAFQIVSAQNSTTDSDALYTGSVIDVKSEFPGGLNEFNKFIAANYKIPSVEKLAGRIYVTFVIEKDGSLTNIRVLRDLKYGTGEEAIRVLKLSPKWKPGEHKGQIVRSTYSLPIAINWK